ncbi:MAG: hypothetical protein KM310_08250 [Clostridiales bacterium]|nr:hypothetical protein [Clostridiales bacterium]
MEALQHRLEKLKASHASLEPVVESLVVKGEKAQGAAGQLALEETLFSLLKDLSGRSLHRIDPVPQLIDKYPNGIPSRLLPASSAGCS